MLLAELRGKIGSAFACRTCGDDDGVDPARAVAIEDGLTSHVFGALRYLPPASGTARVFELLGLPASSDEHVEVTLWPFRQVWIRELGGGLGRALGCEPDATLVGTGAVVVVETKLGMKLGTDPSQLPREARLAHDLAEGRPWRLLCVTADAREPMIHGFCVRGHELALGDLTTIADAVASYFEAERALGDTALGPTPDEVRRSVRWLGWRDVAALLARIAERPGTPTSARALLHDVEALLRQRGLARTTFGGFRRLPGALLSPVGPTWRVRPRARHLWTRLAEHALPRRGATWSVRPRQRLLWSSLREPALASPRPLFFRRRPAPFTSLRAPVLPAWPASGWLAPRTSRKETRRR